jgi:DNA replication protein DnaC
MSLQFHNPAKTRTDSCEKHGAFQSRCFLGSVWSRCPTCETERENLEIAKAEADQRRERLLAWQTKIGNSGIPDRFHERTLDNFEAKSDEQKFALSFARSYAEGFDDVLRTGRSAMFVGKPGTGKTHLAAGIGLRVMAAGRTVLFTTVMRAIRRVKDTWNRDSRETEGQAISAMVFPDLLILDEVGVQFGSDFERNMLFDVLNERYERRKPVLLLSNLPVEEVTAFLGERIVDRLREDGGKLIKFTWESHRGKK